MSPLSGHVLEALCVVGIVGNLLTLVILRRTGDRKNYTNWLLRAQAVVDGLYLVGRLLACRLESSACRDVDWLPLATVVSVTASTMRIVSVWTVVVINVDRYMTVCLPGEVRLRTLRRAKMTVACVVILAVVCCSPLFVQVRNHIALCAPENDEAESVASRPTVHWLVVYDVGCCIVTTMIPFVILLPLSSLTVIRLQQLTRKFRVVKCNCCSRRRSKTLVRKTNWRRSAMLTTVVVFALFIVCQFPQLVLRVSCLLLLLLTAPDVRLDDRVMRQASSVASGLLVVHASANFFVYCAVGNSFRRVLLRLVSCGLADSRVVSSAERKEAAEV